MTNQLKSYIALALVIVLAVVVYYHYKPHQMLGGAVDCGSSTCFTSLGVTTGILEADGGFLSTGATTLSGSVTLSGATTIATTTITGPLRDHEPVYSTSTSATSATLVQNDFVQYGTWFVTPNTGSLTYTIPASSTMPLIVPAAGNKRQIDICNATTTALTNISFVAGTGIDLEIASSSSISTSIRNGSCAHFQIIRLPATASSFDISVQEFTTAEAD